jgi:hypothetical protein
VTKTDHDALGDRLDALSRRIEARSREFKERGAFSGIHEIGLDEFRKRSASIKAKLDAAISKGSMWDIVKSEFERDFHSLSDDFALFEKRLDAETMKQKGKASPTQICALPLTLCARCEQGSSPPVHLTFLTSLPIIDAILIVGE